MSWPTAGAGWVREFCRARDKAGSGTCFGYAPRHMAGPASTTMPASHPVSPFFQPNRRPVARGSDAPVTVSIPKKSTSTLYTEVRPPALASLLSLWVCSRCAWSGALFSHQSFANLACRALACLFQDERPAPIGWHPLALIGSLPDPRSAIHGRYRV